MRPDAPITGANRVGLFNDKENEPRPILESDRFIVAGGKVQTPTPAKEPTVPHSLHRKPVPYERRKHAGQPHCGPVGEWK